MKVLASLLVLAAACGGSQKRDLTKYNAEDRALLEKARFNCAEPEGTDGELKYLKALETTIKAQSGEVSKVDRDDRNLNEKLTIVVPIDQAFFYNVNVATGAGGGEKAVITGAVGAGTPTTQLDEARNNLAVALPSEIKEATYSLEVGFESAPEREFGCVEYVISRFPKTKTITVPPPAEPAAE